MRATYIGDDDEESDEQRQEFHRRVGPPDNEIPGAVPFHALLGRTDEIAVALTHVHSYSTGLLFTIAIRARSNDGGEGIMDGLHDRRGQVRGSGLLIGFAYPDGRTVSSLSSPRFPSRTAPPDQPQLRERGGGGTNTSSTIEYWLTPVPPVGELTLVSVWTAREVPENRAVIPAQALAIAADDIIELWPWQPPNFGRKPEPPPEPVVLPEGSWFATQPNPEG